MSQSNPTAVKNSKRTALVVVVSLLLLLLISGLGYSQKAKQYEVLKTDYDKLENTFEELLLDVKHTEDVKELQGTIDKFRYLKKQLRNENLFSVDMDAYKKTLNKYQKKVYTYYNDEIKKIASKLNTQIAEKEKLEEANKNLKEEKGQFRSDNNNLRNQLRQKNAAIKDLQDKIDELNKKIQDLMNPTKLPTASIIPTPTNPALSAVQQPFSDDSSSLKLNTSFIEQPLVQQASSAMPNEHIAYDLVNYSFYLLYNNEKVILNNNPGHASYKIRSLQVEFGFLPSKGIIDNLLNVRIINNDSKVISKGRLVFRDNKWSTNFTFDDVDCPTPGYYVIEIHYKGKLYKSHKFKIIEDVSTRPQANSIYAYYRKNDKKNKAKQILDTYAKNQNGRKIKKIFIEFSTNFLSPSTSTKVTCKILRNGELFRKVDLSNLNNNEFKGELYFSNSGIESGDYEIKVFYQGDEVIGSYPFKIKKRFLSKR